MAFEPPAPGDQPSPLAQAAAGASDDEQRLIAAVLRKDRKAAADFVSRFADPIYGYVRHRLAPRHDLVEDMVQDVFLAALTGLPRFAGTGSLGAWMLGIARHKVEDFYRRHLREPGSFDDGPGFDEPTSPAPPADEVMDRRRVTEKAGRVLRRLPESYCVALLWRYWENKSAREMAAATGRTEKAVERQLARARARFRDLWKQEEP